jgi:hypothetical protein
LLQTKKKSREKEFHGAIGQGNKNKRIRNKKNSKLRHHHKEGA